MKKITLLLFALLLSMTGFAQFNEGFESTTGPDALPSTNWTLGSGNWAVFDNGVGLAQRWKINTTAANVHGGANAAYVQNENIGINNTSEDYLATPLITVPTNGQLHFWTRTVQSGDQGTKYHIKINTVNGTQTTTANYTTVQQWTETSLVTTYNVYEEKVVDLTAYAGQQVYIAFMMTFTQPSASLGGDRWLVDDVSLVQQCLTPTNIAVNPLSTSASISWTDTNGATSWEVEVVPATSTLTGTGTVVTTNPYNITGLIANTSYICSIRALCSGTNSSTWATTFTFSTTIAPVGCGGNYVDSGGTTGSYSNSENITTLICPTNNTDLVTVTFTAFSTESCCDHLLVYDGSNTSGTLLGTYSGTTLPPVFTSSTPGGCLTFVFNSDSSVTSTGWVANITCAPAPTCSAPTALAANSVLSTSAVLSWTQPQNPGGGTASAWEVIAVPCGSAAPTASTTGWVAAPTNPFTITGLTPTTCYDFYAKAICSGTDSSSWSAVKATATTQALPPVCGGNYVDSGGSNGSYSNSESITTTICPDINTNLVTVTFTAFSTESCCDHLLVYDGTGTSGTLLGTYSGTTLPPVFTSSAPGACLTFVFNSDSSVTSTGWVANITCAPAPTCSAPTAVTTSAVLSTSTTLAWTQPQNPGGGTASAWQVIALPCGSAAPTASSTGWTAAATNPYTITGLTPTTCYDFYVRAVCSVTDSSPWSAVKATATTQALPPVCGGNYVDSGGSNGSYSNSESITTTICPDLSTNLVTVTFTTFSTESCCDHLLVYDGTGTTGTLLGTYSGTTIPPAITSSAPGSCLTFVFNSDSSVTSTGWTANIACAPAPTCSKPVNLTVNSNSTTATLNWTQPQNPDGSTATSWTVIIQPAGAGMPAPNATGVTVTSLPYNVTGLTAGTSYEYWVMAQCTSPDQSTWSGPKTFFTSISCGDSQPFCGNTGLSYQNTTGAPSYGQIGCLFTTPNPSWYYMQVQQSGPLSFQIAQTSTGGTGLDVDYICWGPFTPAQYATMCSNLYNFPSGNTSVPNNVSSCSYSIAAVENFTIANAVAGQYYIVLITNFSNQVGSVTFTQTNNGAGGAGSTNCNIVCSVDLGQNQILCNQSSYTITSTNQNADSYAWYYNSVLIPGQTGSTLVATQSGDYQCVITCGLNTAQDTITLTFQTQQTPTFNAIADFCQNTTAPTLPSTSLNGIAGTWSPATIDSSVAGTVIHTFTPNAGLCATTTTLSVTVLPSVTPTFTPIAPICSGATAPILPTTSNNAVVGTWAPPVVSNTLSGDYVFTASAGQCINTATVHVTVNTTVTPTFINPAPICIGTTAPTLPATSTNAITGTWAPNVVDNSQTATYIFTPDAGQCATQGSLTVTVNPNCAFGSFASAVWLTNCSTSNFFNTVGSGTDIIGPAGNIFPNSNLGTYLQNSSTLILRGAEVKTFKSPTANVCSARLNYRIYPQAGTPGSFTVLDLPFFDNCGGATFPSGGPCNPGDQKWQKVLNNSQSPVDLTQYAPGNYVVEVFYDISGSSVSTSLCDETQYINNGGSNFIANFTIQADPSYASTNPTTCNGTDGTITISNLAPNTTYTLSYNNGTAVGPLTIASDSTGSYVITGLNAGTYTNFLLQMNGCSLSNNNTITLVDPVYTPNFTAVAPICNGDALSPLPTTSLNNITGTWAPTLDNTTTTTYTFTPNAGQCSLTTTLTITVNQPITPTFAAVGPICAGTPLSPLPTTSLEGITGIWVELLDNTTTMTYHFTPDAGQCANTTTLTITVNQPVTPTFNTVGPICNGDTLVALPTTSTNGITGTWSPALDNTTTTLYHFTPDAGQCGVSTSLTIVVNQPVTPTFAAVAAICNGDALAALPTTSTNGITGTWAPALDNTTTTLYHFTPDAGQCATTTTLTITVNQPVTPTFAAVAPICNGDALAALPTTSINNITGTWAPSLDNTATTTYTFTPTSGQCATTTSLTITVNQPVTPTFNAVAAICNGDALTALPTTSINNITGTWAPTLDNTVTTTYTFTPASGQCATTTTLTITVNQPVTPTFNAVAAICSGTTLSALPTTSLNTVTGTWSPALNNTATTTYTFTPASGQCATTTTLTITVNQPVTPNFNPIAAICKGDVLTALPTTSTDLYTGTWAPALNNNVTTTYTFTPATGQCATTTSLTITVNQPATPTFSAIAPLCNGATAPALSPSSIEGVTGTWLPAVISSTQSGTYTFTPNAGQCYTTASLSVTVASSFDFTLTDGCLDNNFTINVNPTNNSFDPNVASYSWSIGATPVPGTEQSLNVTSYLHSLSTQPQLPITFSVLVTDAQNCTQSHSVIVDRIYCEIQKGISPNGDGSNEFFDLRLMNVSNLEIFNRYGTKVYSKSGYSDEWIGQDLKGNELPDGTYYYMIEFSNNQDSKTGWIYINRQAK